MDSTLQLSINESPEGTLVFAFPGRSSVLDLKQFSRAMESELRQRIKRIDRIVFDLTSSNEVANTAGRIFDIAVEYRRRYKRATELRIPQNIYRELHRSDPEALPARPKRSSSVAGVEMILCEPMPVVTNLVRTPQATRSILISCLGKVRRVSDKTITVSLFTDEGEIVGELSEMQFPSMSLDNGQIFKYEAAVVVPGTTQVSIRDIPARELASDEVLALWEDVNLLVPKEEY